MIDLKIKSLPTEIKGVNEKEFRVTAILNTVLQMVSRNDSKETIFEIVEILRSNKNN